MGASEGGVKGKHEEKCSKMGDETGTREKKNDRKKLRKGDCRGRWEEGRMGGTRVMVLSAGNALSEVAVWNHPGPRNS